MIAAFLRWWFLCTPDCARCGCHRHRQSPYLPTIKAGR